MKPQVKKSLTHVAANAFDGCTSLSGLPDLSGLTGQE